MEALRICLSAMLSSVITHLQRRREHPPWSEAASFPAPSCFRAVPRRFHKQIASFGRIGARRAQLWTKALFLKTHGVVSSLRRQPPALFRLCSSTCLPLRWIRWAAEDASAASAASCLYYARAEGRVFPPPTPPRGLGNTLYIYFV